jgi:hypothetical protein
MAWGRQAARAGYSVSQLHCVLTMIDKALEPHLVTTEIITTCPNPVCCPVCSCGAKTHIIQILSKEACRMHADPACQQYLETTGWPTKLPGQSGLIKYTLPQQRSPNIHH